MVRGKLLKLLVVIILLITAFFGYKFYRKAKVKYPGLTRVYTNEKVTEDEGKLIAGFPEIPQYPGISVRTSYKKVQDSKTDYVAVWRFQGEGKTIINWYSKELASDGWKVTGPFIDESEDYLHIEAENNNYKLKIQNTEEDGDETKKILVAEFLEK